MGRMQTELSPLDRMIGAHIRAARVARGMSQEKLGEGLGLTFQQVQKYEKGTNRVATSTLLRIAALLEIAPMDLVPELKGTGKEPPAPAPITNAQALEAARLIAGMRIPQHRHAILGMIRTFAEPIVEPVSGGEEARAA